MREMTDAEQELAANLFEVNENAQDKDGVRLTVRFDTETLKVYHANMRREGKRQYKRPYRGVTVLRYVETEGARTPTGGKYTRRNVLLRLPDGQKWMGTLRKDSDLVTLRPYRNS